MEPEGGGYGVGEVRWTRFEWSSYRTRRIRVTDPTTHPEETGEEDDDDKDGDKSPRGQVFPRGDQALVAQGKHEVALQPTRATTTMKTTTKKPTRATTTTKKKEEKRRRRRRQGEDDGRPTKTTKKKTKERRGGRRRRRKNSNFPRLDNPNYDEIANNRKFFRPVSFQYDASKD